MILWNIVWPAIYVYDEVWRFWFLVFATIVVETFTIMAMLKYSLKKSFIASVIGNLVSGLIGSFIMMWAMLLWHLAADRFVPQATFDIINWIATYIIMCFGSVFIETITIKIFFKSTIKKIFFPLLVGNLLTYSFIAYSMIFKTDEDPNEKRTEQIEFIPSPNNFTLLDNTELSIFTAQTMISYDEDDKILNTDYALEIPFKEEKPENSQFRLRFVDNGYDGGFRNEKKIIFFYKLTDTIRILLEQKNPHPNIGWTAPIITDTIHFIKQDIILKQNHN